jgi:uncharacterized membrane protein YfcA
MIWIIGSYLIWLLSGLLDNDRSFSFVTSIIGFGVIPLIFPIIILFFIKFLNNDEKIISNINFFIKFVSILWSSYSCSKYIIKKNNEKKKLMIMYPIFLLFIYLISIQSGL